MSAAEIEISSELIERLSQSPYPIRQRSANGEPKPKTGIERTCRKCGASFIGLAPGKTGKRGIWTEWTWWCSQECVGDTADRAALNGEDG